MRRTLLTLSAVLLAHIATGQTFESATIKPSYPRAGVYIFHGYAPGTITIRHASLRSLLAGAFGVEEAKIAGPSWLDTEYFDIDAQAALGSTSDQVRIMKQNLLTSRFRIASHTETRSIEGYLLVVAPAGEKLKPFDDTQMTSTGTVCRKCSMAEFAALLSRPLRKLVVDATDIKGRFNFELQLPPTSEPARAPVVSAAMPNSPVDRRAVDGSDIEFSRRGITLWAPNPSGVSPGNCDNFRAFSAALESRLGLKLEKKKVPVDMLVIDHIAK